jgi:hypothetical protein
MNNQRGEVKKICVVHLVRKKNELAVFERFINSYKFFDAGIDHDLIIIYKGFKAEFDIFPYEEKIIDTKHKIYKCSDIGYDLKAYSSCFKKFKNNYEYFCFLNSFSELNGENWLRKLWMPFNDKGVGLVGATGSYGTMVPKYQAPSSNLATWKKVLRPILLPLLIRFKELSFDGFPNPHIRTNGFIISTAIFNKIKFPLFFRKLEAYKFESGRFGLTNQVKLLGLKCVIVGNNGNSYSENNWPESEIFWSSKQENLLIKDNQTNYYENADNATKKKLTISAWHGS